MPLKRSQLSSFLNSSCESTQEKDENYKCQYCASLNLKYNSKFKELDQVKQELNQLKLQYNECISEIKILNEIVKQKNYQLQSKERDIKQLNVKIEEQEIKQNQLTQEIKNQEQIEKQKKKLLQTNHEISQQISMISAKINLYQNSIRTMFQLLLKNQSNKINLDQIKFQTQDSDFFKLQYYLESYKTLLYSYFKKFELFSLSIEQKQRSILRLQQHLKLNEEQLLNQNELINRHTQFNFQNSRHTEAYHQKQFQIFKKQQKQRNLKTLATQADHYNRFISNLLNILYSILPSQINVILRQCELGLQKKVLLDERTIDGLTELCQKQVARKKEQQKMIRQSAKVQLSFQQSHESLQKAQLKLTIIQRQYDELRLDNERLIRMSRIGYKQKVKQTQTEIKYKLKDSFNKQNEVYN